MGVTSALFGTDVAIGAKSCARCMINQACVLKQFHFTFSLIYYCA